MEYSTDQLPLGFGMALAQNANALKIFGNLSESEKQKYISLAHGVNSKNEMNALVQQLAGNSARM